MNDEVKIRIFVTKGDLVLHEMHGSVDGGRHELRFGQPVRCANRELYGVSVECWLDAEPRHLRYSRIELPFGR